MNKKKIIFVQAPFHLGFALNLIKEDDHTEYGLFVVGNKSIFYFLKELKIKNTKIYYIEYKNIKFRYIITIFYERHRLRKIFRKYFLNINYADIYFFSIYFDYITFFLVNKLKNKNNLHFCEIELVKKGPDVSRLFNQLLYYLITGIKFSFTKRYDENILTYKLQNDIELVEKSYFKDQHVIYKKYRQEIYLDINSILILDNNEDSKEEILNYESTMDKILSIIIKCGFKINVKAHPRLGLSEFYKKRKNIVKVVECSIPNEFIKYINCMFFIGVASTAIISDVVRSISLLKLFQYTTEDYSKYFIDYLKKHSKKEIDFPAQFSELQNFLIESKQYDQ